jgi:hypothetical protein
MMKEGASVLTSLSLDKLGFGGGSICSSFSSTLLFSIMKGSTADENELGKVISVVFPFSIYILGVESNKALACSDIISRSRSKSN